MSEPEFRRLVGKLPKTVVVYYPSGAHATLSGYPVIMRLDDWLTPCLELTEASKVFGEYIKAGGLLVLDPRAAIVGEEDHVLYVDPRGNPQPPDWAREWLEQHPEWPMILEAIQ